MKITELDFPGVYEIEMAPIGDHRGFFMRTFDEKVFNAHGIGRNWVQENHSLSKAKGVIRGLHLQLPPDSESKLIRVVKGEIMDVFVDLRKDSPKFGKWGSKILSGQNHKALLLPRGTAHGFCTLTEDCEVIYKVDSYYAPKSEVGLLWSDPDLAIDWPVKEPVISDKDSKGITFKEFVARHGALMT